MARKKHKGDVLEEMFPNFQHRLQVDLLPSVRYLDGTVKVRHKELEGNLRSVWNELHPFLRETYVSYCHVLKSTMEKVSDVEGLQRRLEMEMDNSSELSEDIAKLKSQVGDLLIDKSKLDEQLTDVMDNMEEKMEQETKTLRELLQTKTGVSADNISEIISSSIAGKGDSADVAKLRSKLESVKGQLDEERSDFQRIQGEVGAAFQERIMQQQEKIDRLERELKEARGN